MSWIILGLRSDIKISPMITRFSQVSRNRIARDRGPFLRNILEINQAEGLACRTRLLMRGTVNIIHARMPLNTHKNEEPVVSGIRPEPESARIWTVANLLTLFRIVLIVPFLYKINEGAFGQALLIFFIASVTDFADGYIARKYAQHTSLGRFLDPLADKLLTTVGFVVMAIPHPGFPSIPVWIAAAVVGRDLIILLGSLAVYLLTGFKDFKPTLLGKINTFLELGLIVVFLGFHSGGILIFLLPLCYAIVIVSVVASGGQYMLEGARIIRDHFRLRRP